MKTSVLQIWHGAARIAVFCSFLSSLLSPQLLIAGPPPNISVQPSDQAVLNGGTAVFTVTATSTTALSYQWNYKVLGVNTPILGANSNIFSIQNAQASNVGTYNVNVINANGTKPSTDANLTLINSAPVANNDAFTTLINTPITNGVSPAPVAASMIRNASLVNTAGISASVNNPASVLSNDTDPDGNALTAKLVSSVSNGTITFYSNGTFNYTPNTDFVGTDSFTYAANDGTLTSAVASVIITVTAASTTIPSATATTLPANNLLTVSATVNAAINPQGSTASCYFQYGTTTNYGLATTPHDLIATTNTLNVSDAITGLTFGTDYHCSVVVTGPGGLTVGNDVVFSTPQFDNAALTIYTNGYGSVTPWLNGALLVIGQSYSLTSSPAATGVTFTGWKDAGNNLVATNPVLNFVMASNLTYTANFVDAIKPTLSITNAPSGLTISNAAYIVKGTASDNLALANVFYNLNNTGWTSTGSANGWNSWAATIGLNPGTNTFSVCALDVSGNYSATNSLAIVYVPVSVLTVRTNGLGTISPALNGSVLRVGQSYTLTATPVTGFAFTNWSDNKGLINTNKSALTFVMTSNLVLTASFVDVTKPTLTVTTPAATTSSTNEFYLASGKGADNVSVSVVAYKLNDGGWSATTTTNNWTNWWVTLDLTPGTNSFSAYAADASGNLSATNTVKFIYTTASTALTGLKAVLSPGTPDMAPFELAFAAGTFSQLTRDTNNYTSVGNYTYTKLTPNTATLKLIYTAPPSAANGGAQTLALSFTAPNVASYFNPTNNRSGVIQFVTATNLVPASLASQSLIFVGSDGRARSNTYAASTYVSVDLQSRATNKGTSYTYATYSPLAALLKETDTNGMTYMVASFMGTNYGAASSESYNAAGSYTSNSIGFFGRVSLRAGGNAPTNLYNRSLTFDSVGSRFKLSLDTNTFAQFSPTAAFDTGVGNYAYERLNTNVASLTLAYTAPSDLVGSVDAVRLNFFANNLATFTNADGTIGSAILRSSTKLSPDTMSGAAITTTNYAGNNLNQFTFNSDNTFVISGFLNVTGTYSYATYSPEGGLVQLVFNDGSLAGDTGTLQLDFDALVTGKYHFRIFDSTSTLIGSSTGFFGRQ